MDYLICPQCKALTFFVETDAGVVFFKLNGAGAAVQMQPSNAGLQIDPGTPVECTACAWTGTPAELKALRDRLTPESS